MRSLISASIMAGLLCAMPYAAQADDDKPGDCKPGQILAESMDLSSCYGNGDKAPDQFIRDAEAIKDWHARGLPNLMNMNSGCKSAATMCWSIASMR